ncbi:hypothetical protein P3T29_004538, partial [Kitasatospora sp. MAP5-34]|nr:hypothetical protein [Kitasatospora sp. MAP5-34]
MANPLNQYFCSRLRTGLIVVRVYMDCGWIRFMERGSAKVWDVGKRSTANETPENGAEII